MEKWRLLVQGSFDAPTNMAIDEFLLNNSDTPVFRLYSWNPACFSIGRFQNPDNVLKPGVPFVRRMTGGGAIYHDAEITYSMVCKPSKQESYSVKDGYRKLSAFLLSAYRKLGQDARYACETDNPSGHELGAPSGYCFSGREEFDIVIGGKKIGGNAQRIVKHRVFQHGSIPLHIIRGNYLPLLVTPSHHSDYTGLSELMGIFPDRGQIAELLIESFSESMGVRFEQSELTHDEWAAIECLIGEKYSDPEWNYPGTKMRAETI
ncbi:MAG: lipoate--protein ligase family protein [Brevinematales bacterium]|nr:lipoate--protein ligase family protein [Brevinematales bacterium]